MSTQPQNMDPAHLWHFVELMCAMKDNGELTSNAFRQEQFQALSDALFRQFGARFTPLYFRKKFNYLKSEWKLYRDHKYCSGVTVEPHTGALNASEEQWAFWIQRNTNVRKFRKNGPPCYDELTKLFKDNTATGDIDIEQGNAPNNSDEDRAMENLHSQQGGATMSWQQGGNTFGQGLQMGQGSGVNEIRGSSRRSGKRSATSGGGDSSRSSNKNRDESIGMALECWAKGQLAKQGSAEDNVSVYECMTILNEMGIPDDSLYVKATNYFHNPTNRVIFKLIDPSRRLTLIQNTPTV